MKLFTVIIGFFLVIGCKSDKKEVAQKEKQPLTILEKVANAHGFENWQNIESIGFTFNVDRDGNHFQRSWTWEVKDNTVEFKSATDTLRYNRKTMDSVAYKTNAGFINDRYWILAPFNLVWDRDNFSYEHSENEIAPLSEEPMQKLTVVYGNEGGYTPGDAYDFYFGDDYILKEWVFRKGNQDEPSMTTTWETYKDTLGLKLATEHKTPGKDFNIYFDGIDIRTK